MSEKGEIKKGGCREGGSRSSPEGLKRSLSLLEW